ncbi:MAG TPA: hypothetical protein VL101_06615, partial [Nordella sp.]|nr:hypothetical protein [Nordella sp.]
EHRLALAQALFGKTLRQGSLGLFQGHARILPINGVGRRKDGYEDKQKLHGSHWTSLTSNDGSF